MGYFSNGSEGEGYEEQWCSRCLHNDGCAVWSAHQLHNYEECNKPDSILHMLIPRDNGQCRMFVDAGLLSPLVLQQYRSAESGRAA